MQMHRRPWRWDWLPDCLAQDHHTLTMQAFFFGAAGRRLFAAFHEAEPASGSSAADQLPAVLLCAPLGQEAIRSHRLLRVLGDTLARRGVPVLRFDAFGTGDAEGVDEDLELPGWVADCMAAATELARLAPGRPQAWLGLRLGATVACRAAGRWTQPAAAGLPRPPLQRLVLCEPVLHGPGYLDELAYATVNALESSFSIRQAWWRQSLLDAPEQLQQEGLGFALGERFFRQLQALREQHVLVPASVELQVVVPAQLPDAPGPSAPGRESQAGAVDAWFQGLATVPGSGLHAVPYHFDWTAEEALNTAIVPAALLAAMGGLCLGHALGQAGLARSAHVRT